MSLYIINQLQQFLLLSQLIVYSFSSTRYVLYIINQLIQCLILLQLLFFLQLVQICDLHILSVIFIIELDRHYNTVGD